MIESVEVKCHSYEQNQSFELKKMIRRDDGTSGGGGGKCMSHLFTEVFCCFTDVPLSWVGVCPLLAGRVGGVPLPSPSTFQTKQKNPTQNCKIFDFKKAKSPQVKPLGSNKRTPIDADLIIFGQ